MKDEILYKAHPAMFKNHPIGFVFTVILCATGIGFIIFLVWWLKTIGTQLIVTDDQITLRKGIFSKYTSDVYHSDVRSVQIKQSFMQRILDVGDIDISSAGQSGIEIEIKGIRQPELVRELIDTYRRKYYENGE